MGFLKNLLRAAIQTQVLKQRQASKSQHTVSRQQETSAERDIREKQKLANDIRAQAKIQSQQLLKIVKDCAELVNTTVNPEVFFNRYNLMLKHLETLTGYECTGIFDKSPELPSEAFLRIEAQFGMATIDFLNRSFESAKKHAETLKTDSGRKNAIKRYFDNIEKYITQMSGESLEYFDKMRDNYLN